MTLPVSVAVIGFGLSARVFHLPFVSQMPQFELLAISTSQQAAAQAAYPQARVYADAEALLKACPAELVIITAPNAWHFSLAQLALQRGKHVVLEKPFVNTVAEAETLIALAAAQGLQLSVFHNRRWDGDFLTVRQLLAEGRLGQLHSFASHFDRFRPTVQSRWREQPGPGAGAWFDLGAHLLDQALCLFGLPQTLTGRCLALRAGAEVTDYFQVQLHYPELEVHLHGSPFAAGPKLRFQLQGSRGAYLKYGLDPQEERLKTGVLPLSAEWAAEAPEAYGQLFLADDQGAEGQAEALPTLTGGYQRYFEALASALRGQGALPVPAAEAMQVIRLLLLAELSSQQGRSLAL